MGIWEKIKMALGALRFMNKVDISTVKAGIKSTEFWVGIATAALIFANSYFELGFSEEAINNFVLLAVSYIGGRSVVKGADAVSNKTERVIVEEEEDDDTDG